MSDEPSANLHDPDVLTEALRLAQERMPSGGTADEFYTRPDGVAEAAWMRPHRELVDGLGVTAGTRRALHAMVDEVYAQGRVDADEEAGASRQLAQAILSRALQLAAPEPSAVQRLRDAANEADSGPKAAELHQAADEAQAARTDEAAHRYGPFSDAPELAAACRAIEGMACGTEGQRLTRAFTEAIAAVALTAAAPLIAARVRAERDGEVRLLRAERDAQAAVKREYAGRWEAAEAKLARVRAEERQRIANKITARKSARFSNLGNRKFREGWDLALDAALSDIAAGSAAPVATPEHDARCERAYGQAVCFCQRRADVQFSHTAGPAAAPEPCQLCSAADHAACSAARQDSYCCCPVPFPGPVVATPTEPATTPGGVAVPASVCLTCADQWFECPDCGGTRRRGAAEQDGQR